MTQAVVGIDVGVTSMKGALFTRDGSALAAEIRPTPAHSGDAAVVAAIRAFAVDLAATPGYSVVGAGVCVPGLVDSASGIARYAAKLGWHNVPLARLIGEDLGVPALLEHDVRAAGAAEGVLGVARGLRQWLFLRVGTGLAAAATVDGRMQRGATGSAGEFGHMPIYPFGEVCACGQRGCVEAYASAASIARRYGAVAGSALTAREIALRVGRDPLADEVWGQACAALGVALASYVMINDPELIVIGGALSGAGETLLAPVREELRVRLVWREAPRMALARLGAEAGRSGAGLLGWQAAGYPDIAADGSWDAHRPGSAAIVAEPSRPEAALRSAQGRGNPREFAEEREPSRRAGCDRPVRLSPRRRAWPSPRPRRSSAPAGRRRRRHATALRCPWRSVALPPQNRRRRSLPR